MTGREPSPWYHKSQSLTDYETWLVHFEMNWASLSLVIDSVSDKEILLCVYESSFTGNI